MQTSARARHTDQISDLGGIEQVRQLVDIALDIAPASVKVEHDELELAGAVGQVPRERPGWWDVAELDRRSIGVGPLPRLGARVNTRPAARSQSAQDCVESMRIGFDVPLAVSLQRHAQKGAWWASRTAIGYCWLRVWCSFAKARR